VHTDDHEPVDDMPPRAQDVRLGEMLRALRRKQKLTQDQVAAAVGASRRSVGRIERGRVADLSVGLVRDVFEACDARLYLNAWWNGVALDRLLDERHAGITERAIPWLHELGWLTALEVTFNEYGDRGSIDILAAHEATHSALIGEVKGSIGSTEETNRILDMKVRVAPNLVERRFGWRPATVSRLLILPNDASVRRVVNRHGETFGSAYPVRGVAVRRWLRQPVGAISGLCFLSESRSRQGVQRST
jgi:transcriptional regulator with XRE-family HTH domain